MLADVRDRGDMAAGSGIDDLPVLPGKRGELKMRLGLQGQRTVIKDLYNQVPLKIAKPFYLEPQTGEIFIYQMNPAGGMVQGDNYFQEIEIETGGRAFFTTQSATKLYRTPDSYTCQYNSFKLGRGALFEYFPDPVIPFAGARFVSDTVLHLTGGATAFMAEVVTPGRIKRGEVFQYISYTSRTRVYWDNALVMWDNWKLAPQASDMGSPAVYEGFTHQGNLYIFSEKVTGELAARLAALFEDRPGMLAGASLTMKNGIAVRVLGHRSDRVENALAECWDLARLALVGIGRPKIRKY